MSEYERSPHQPGSPSDQPTPRPPFAAQPGSRWAGSGPEPATDPGLAQRAGQPPAPDPGREPPASGPGEWNPQHQWAQQRPWTPTEQWTGSATGAYPQPGYQPGGYAGPGGWVSGRDPHGGGSRLVSLLMVLALMVLAGVGGGVAGAWVYAQSQGPGAGLTAGGTTVVDAPQLDYTSLASIASEVTPTVVQVQAGEGSGSGVVMSEDGYILTNAHVVEVAPGDQVLVRFSSGETAPAQIVGTDPHSDIAVVRAEGVPSTTAASFGDSDDVLVGDTVLAIGSPLGFQGSVTQGIVSAQGRTLPVGGGPEPQRSLSGLLQTDASINPGNSGGPLVNLAGEVIGINTAIATDGQASGFLGLGFAVPSNRATDVAEQLIAGEEVRHAFLGVSVNNAETGGALIADVVAGSPAEQAGLAVGDVVVRIGEHQITDRSDLVNAVHQAAPGEQVEVEFQRDGRSQTTVVTLTEVED